MRRRPSVTASPAAPASHPSQRGKTRKTAIATRPSPTMSSWRWSRTGRRNDATEERRARRRGADLDARFGAFFVVRAGDIGGACSSFDASPLPSSPQHASSDVPCSRVTSPIVRAQGLVKTVGQGRAARRVLDGAALEVSGGELVAVVGRSGSGKSTLLHLLGGLDKAEAGTIELAGERVDGRSERDLARLRARRPGLGSPLSPP